MGTCRHWVGSGKKSHCTVYSGKWPQETDWQPIIWPSLSFITIWTSKLGPIYKSYEKNFLKSQKICLGVSDMAQWIKVLGAKPEDMSSTLEPTCRRRELTSEGVLWPPRAQYMHTLHTSTDTQVNKYKKSFAQDSSHRNEDRSRSWSELSWWRFGRVPRVCIGIPISMEALTRHVHIFFLLSPSGCSSSLVSFLKS